MQVHMLMRDIGGCNQLFITFEVPLARDAVEQQLQIGIQRRRLVQPHAERLVDGRRHQTAGIAAIGRAGRAIEAGLNTNLRTHSDL
jgi:hypothetical protein